MKGPWRNFEYRCVPGMIAFWQRRAVKIETGRKHIWYAAPDPDHPTDPRKAITDNGSRLIPRSLRDRSVHGLDDIREAKVEGRGADLVWTEGETDKEAVNREGFWAFTHPNAAGSSTPEQAGHLRRYRGMVYVAADRDDAGYNCAARRAVQLHGVGIPWKRIEVVAAAVEHPGADVRDHIAAGFELDEMVPLALGDLRAAVERERARTSSGGGTTGLAGPATAFYHGGRLSLTDDEWEQALNSPLFKSST